MAEINVEKKSSFPWWIWIIVALIVIGIIFFLVGGDDVNTGTDDRHRDTRDHDRDTRDTRDTVRRPATTAMIPASEEMNFAAIEAEYPNFLRMPITAIT